MSYVKINIQNERKKIRDDRFIIIIVFLRCYLLNMLKIIIKKKVLKKNV